MKIVAVAACTSGIAHTYVVILAVDIQITGTERFKDKKVVKVGTSLVTKAPKQLLEKVEAELNKTK